MSEKFFSVIVGGQPNKVEVGFLDDEGKPKGETMTAYIEKAGTAVPNYSRVWGKRVLDAKKEPTGDITFLEWGHPDGHMIEIRYLKNSQSLDMEFQKKKGIRVKDEDAELHLVVGVNNFKPVQDKMLIEMLKHHYQNGENNGREPGIPVAFNTYDGEKINKLKVTDVQMRQEAENIVIGANNDGNASLEILASLFRGIDPRQQQDVLFTELMDLTPKFGFFLEVMDHHRKEFRELIEKSKELELIDVSPKDAIYLIKNGQKEILLQDIESGKDDKIMHVLRNFYKPAYFNQLTVLKQAFEKYAAVLQE